MVSIWLTETLEVPPRWSFTEGGVIPSNLTGHMGGSYSVRGKLGSNALTGKTWCLGSLKWQVPLHKGGSSLVDVVVSFLGASWSILVRPYKF